MNSPGFGCSADTAIEPSPAWLRSLATPGTPLLVVPAALLIKEPDNPLALLALLVGVIGLAYSLLCVFLERRPTRRKDALAPHRRDDRHRPLQAPERQLGTCGRR